MYTIGPTFYLDSGTITCLFLFLILIPMDPYRIIILYYHNRPTFRILAHAFLSELSTSGVSVYQCPAVRVLTRPLLPHQASWDDLLFFFFIILIKDGIYILGGTCSFKYPLQPSLTEKRLVVSGLIITILIQYLHEIKFKSCCPTIYVLCKDNITRGSDVLFWEDHGDRLVHSFFVYIIYKVRDNFQ